MLGVSPEEYATHLEYQLVNKKTPHVYAAYKEK